MNVDDVKKLQVSSNVTIHNALAFHGVINKGFMLEESKGGFLLAVEGVRGQKYYIKDLGDKWGLEPIKMFKNPFFNTEEADPQPIFIDKTEEDIAFSIANRITNE